MNMILRLIPFVVCLCTLCIATDSAAESGPTKIMAGADSCTLADGVPCDVVAAGIINSSRQMSTGMLLGVKTVDSHPQEVLDLVAAAVGEVVEFGNTRAGRYAIFSGDGYIESHGRLIAADDRAEWMVSEWGAFTVEISGQVFTGNTSDPQTFVFADEPSQPRGDTGTHEVGHWMALYHTATREIEITLLVGAPNAEGYPEIAGNFRETADGETGHVHGHLDYLKQTGDPATDGPSSADSVRFDGEGEATFHYDDGREVVSFVKLETDPNDKILKFEAPAVGLRLEFPYRDLPCPGRCRDGAYHVSDF